MTSQREASVGTIVAREEDTAPEVLTHIVYDPVLEQLVRRHEAAERGREKRQAGPELQARLAVYGFD